MPASKITIDATPEAIAGALAAVTALNEAEAAYDQSLAAAQEAYDRAKADADEKIGRARAAARAAGLSFASVSVGRQTGGSRAPVAPDAVLAHLQRGHDSAKTVGQIAREGSWTDTTPVSAALKSLVDEGRAAKLGQLRGTKYYLP